MSDTPIYDALEALYQDRRALNDMTTVMDDYIDSIETRDFELTEEDLEEVPALLAGAVKVVGILLKNTLAERQAETRTDGEFRSYVVGILAALSYLRGLPPPTRVK